MFQPHGYGKSGKRTFQRFGLKTVHLSIFCPDAVHSEH